MSKITLIGMERYLNPDHSVFENMQLPEGIDKDTLIGSIILRCQEFELLFSDPDFMIAAVNVWSRKNYWTFDKWVKLINEDYDPLYNKDYHETYDDTHRGNYSKEGHDSNSGNNSRSTDMTTTNDLTTRADNTSVIHSEKAYNDSGFVETTKDVSSGPVKNFGTVSDEGTITDQYGNKGANDESGNDFYLNNHTYHGYGNIGITSAQELFMKQTDVARWNMYEHIADLFCQEFCIMIY